MRGLQVPMSETETRSGPLPGAYETSDLANVLGILTALGSIKTGANTSAGGDFLNWVGGGLKQLLPSDWSNLFQSTDIVGTEPEDRMSEEDFRRLFGGRITEEEYRQIFPGATN